MARRIHFDLGLGIGIDPMKVVDTRPRKKPNHIARDLAANQGYGDYDQEAYYFHPRWGLIPDWTKDPQ